MQSSSVRGAERVPALHTAARCTLLRALTLRAQGKQQDLRASWSSLTFSACAVRSTFSPASPAACRAPPRAQPRAQPVFWACQQWALMRCAKLTIQSAGTNLLTHSTPVQGGFGGFLGGVLAGAVSAAVLPVMGLSVGCAQVVRGLIATPEAVYEPLRGKRWCERCARAECGSLRRL